MNDIQKILLDELLAYIADTEARAEQLAMAGEWPAAAGWRAATIDTINNRLLQIKREER